MRLGQIKWFNNSDCRHLRAGRHGASDSGPHHVRPDPAAPRWRRRRLRRLRTRLASAHREAAEPMIPIHPREVWACGCTYETSAAFRDAEHGTREGFYAYVYREPRPEIFFKGTARVCVGPNQTIGIRADSKFTAPEPELAAGPREQRTDSRLHARQRRVGLGHRAREPAVSAAVEGVHRLLRAWPGDRHGRRSLRSLRSRDDLHHRARRDTTMFSGSVSTGAMSRKFETLIEYLLRANPVPAGSVLLTGTGIIVTEEAALAARRYRNDRDPADR